jgi:cell division protein FtsI (penicillin-binding protein 3)
MILAGRWARVRIAVCGAAFVGLFVAVGKRAYNLQVRDADRLRAMAEEQYLREIELPPRRGRILDRNGADLASTADVDSIYCNPRQLPDPADAARKLARLLGLDRAELEKKLEQRRFFAWVKRKVTPEEAAAVKALRLPGMAAPLLPEPHSGGHGDGALGRRRQRARRRRAGARQAAARDDVVGAGGARRAGARHRRRRDGRRPQHQRQ